VRHPTKIVCRFVKMSALLRDLPELVERGRHSRMHWTIGALLDIERFRKKLRRLVVFVFVDQRAPEHRERRRGFRIVLAIPRANDGEGVAIVALSREVVSVLVLN